MPPTSCGRQLSGGDAAVDRAALGRRGPRGRYRCDRKPRCRRALYAGVRASALVLSPAATASRATAVDAVYTDFRNPEGLRREAAVATRDGFTAKAAIHPDQAAIINEVFTPSAEEVARARRVVELFEAGGATGVVALDGKMLDRPHLTVAKRLLSRARQG